MTLSPSPLRRPPLRRYLGVLRQPPVVQVSRAVEREVTNYVDYTGRTDAVESVGVRARVTPR